MTHRFSRTIRKTFCNFLCQNLHLKWNIYKRVKFDANISIWLEKNLEFCFLKWLQKGMKIAEKALDFLGNFLNLTSCQEKARHLTSDLKAKRKFCETSVDIFKNRAPSGFKILNFRFRSEIFYFSFLVIVGNSRLLVFILGLFFEVANLDQNFQTSWSIF